MEASTTPSNTSSGVCDVPRSDAATGPAASGDPLRPDRCGERVEPGAADPCVLEPGVAPGAPSAEAVATSSRRAASFPPSRRSLRETWLGSFAFVDFVIPGAVAPPLDGTCSTYCEIPEFAGGTGGGSSARATGAARKSADATTAAAGHLLTPCADGMTGTVATVDERAEHIRDRDSGAAATARLVPPRRLTTRFESLRQSVVAAGGDRIAVFVMVGGAAFAIAAYGGTYGVTGRTSLAIAVWWIVLVGVALGVWPRAGIRRSAISVGVLLLAFALFSGLSGLWGQSAEKGFVEANRVALYVGVFALTAVATSRRTAATWSDALGAASAALAVIAVLSRLFPNLFSQGPLPTFLPYAYTRLSFPVNYWNGLAILVALGIPLLLRVAVARPARAARAAAIAPLPVIVVTIYLTSSRTGAVTAGVGALLFLVLTERRWAAVGAIVVGAAASAAAIAWLVHEHELVNGPLDSSAAVSQGRWSALVFAAICVLAGVAYAAAADTLPRYVQPSPRAGRITAVACALGAVAVVVALHPVRRFEEFKRPPPVYAAREYIHNHFLSTNGNWRWQYWTASAHEFERHPWGGGGAASFEAWWAERGTTVGFVRNAHSLYPEVLGELGIVGLLLLVATFGTGIAVGVRRALRAPPGERATAAAVIAAFAAFAIAAGLDWMWQLTAVSVIGMATLALSVGPATDTAESRPQSSPRLRLVLAVLAAIPLLGAADLLAASTKVDDSQAAARRGDLAAAVNAARAAKRLEPWASSPYLQLALVQEEDGRLSDAHGSISKAISRDRRDWRLWLVAARIETKLGRIVDARVSLHRAIELNPRSPIFATR